MRSGESGEKPVAYDSQVLDEVTAGKLSVALDECVDDVFMLVSGATFSVFGRGESKLTKPEVLQRIPSPEVVQHTIGAYSAEIGVEALIGEDELEV